MIKKDYELIAKAINKVYGETTTNEFNTLSKPAIAYAIEKVTEQLADNLKLDNPRFNRDKFLTACGLKGN